MKSIFTDGGDDNDDGDVSFHYMFSFCNRNFVKIKYEIVYLVKNTHKFREINIYLIDGGLGGGGE